MTGRQGDTDRLYQVEKIDDQQFAANKATNVANSEKLTNGWIRVFDSLGGQVDIHYLSAIVGNSSNNNLNGSDASNNIAGGSGNDTIDGGTGNDWVYGDNGTDVLYRRWQR